MVHNIPETVKHLNERLSSRLYPESGSPVGQVKDTDPFVHTILEWLPVDLSLAISYARVEKFVLAEDLLRAFQAFSLTHADPADRKKFFLTA